MTITFHFNFGFKLHPELKKVTSAFHVHPSNEGKGAYPIKAKHRWQVQPCARVILKRLRILREQLARRATAPYHFFSSLVGGCLKNPWPWFKTLALDECPFNLRLILWPLQKLFTILKVGKWAKSALLLMSTPRRYSLKNIALRLRDLRKLAQWYSVTEMW